jgi:methionyl-tRNA formyltransferase
MRIVLLCGNQPNQIALANKLASKHELAGVVLENKKKSKPGNFKVKDIFGKVLDLSVFRLIRNTWKQLMNYYSVQYPSIPGTVSQKIVSSVNSPEVVQFITSLQPDLLLVSGTSIVREGILNLNIPNGILNLHTGLSPYVKGGPNCTNWCIATKQAHLIGNTVMWIDAGIDSGDIVTTELVPLTGDESFFELHLKVMEHAHQLYINSVDAISLQTRKIKQADISLGKIYYTRMWNTWFKLSLLFNFLFSYKNEMRNRQKRIDKEEIVTYPLSK